MSIVKYKNNKPAHSMSNIWDDFFKRDLWDSSNAWVSGSTTPAVNIKETDESWDIELASPGFDKKDFHIEVNEGQLTISAEKKAEKNEEKGEYTRKEFAYEQFTRTFTLPETVEEGKIKANYDNGILNIQVPKKEEAKPQPARTITVK